MIFKSFQSIFKIKVWHSRWLGSWRLSPQRFNLPTIVIKLLNDTIQFGVIRGNLLRKFCLNSLQKIRNFGIAIPWKFFFVFNLARKRAHHGVLDPLGDEYQRLFSWVVPEENAKFYASYIFRGIFMRFPTIILRWHS